MNAVDYGYTEQEFALIQRAQTIDGYYSLTSFELEATVRKSAAVLGIAYEVADRIAADGRLAGLRRRASRHLRMDADTFTCEAALEYARSLVARGGGR